MLGAFALGTIPLGSAPFIAETGGSALLALSDREFATSPTDVPANTGYEPRIKVPLVIDRQIPLSAAAGSRAAISYGEIIVANDDGFFDRMLDGYAVDGRQVRVKVGTPDLAYSEFEQVYVGTALRWQAVSESDVRIAVRDTLWRTVVPIQTNLYAGTGDYEGGFAIQAKPKPLCYGTCFNVPATLVDPARLIYQVHDGPVLAINGVYSSGGPAQAMGDVTDLYNPILQIESGTFYTDVGRGLFRLGDAYGPVTADVAGDAPGQNWTSNTAAIVRRILQTRGGLGESELDASSFDFLAAAQPAEVGVFVSSEERPTVAAVVDQLMVGISGWWGSSRLGKIQVGRVEGPSVFTYVLLDETNIISIEKVDAGQPISPPPWRWVVGYQRNWSVLSAVSLFLEQERQEFLTTEYRYAGAWDENITVKHLLASDPPAIAGLFAWQPDAQAEADRLLALWGEDRPIYRVTTKLAGILADIGSTAYLTYPRFAMNSGVLAQVVGVRIDADRNEAQLTVIIGFPPPVYTPFVLPPGLTGAQIYSYTGAGGAYAVPTSAGIATSLRAGLRVYVGTGGAYASGYATAQFVSRTTSQTLVAPTPTGGGHSSGAGLTAKVSNAWVPSTANLPGLQGWFHPGSGKTIVGGKVSQWNDASGLNNHLTQGTDALRPLNKADALAANASVQFTGSQYMVGNGVATNPANVGTGDDTPFSFACVVSIDQIDVYSQLYTAWNSAGNANILAYKSSSLSTGTFTHQRRDDTNAYKWGNSFFQPGPEAGRFYIFEQIFSGGQLKSYIDGTMYGDVACDVGTMSAFDRFVMGVNKTLDGYFMVGQFVEFFIGARNAWTDPQRAQLENYLSSKYGITVGAGVAWAYPTAQDDTIDTQGLAIVGVPYPVDPLFLTGNDTHDSRTTIEVYSVGDGVTTNGTVSLDTTDAENPIIWFTPNAAGTGSFQYNIRDGHDLLSFARCNLLNMAATADVALVEDFSGGTDVPSITDTRAGTATYVDANGDVQIAPANTQRFDYS